MFASNYSGGRPADRRRGSALNLGSREEGYGVNFVSLTILPPFTCEVVGNMSCRLTP
jgi:hypothetical protein